MRLKIPVWLKAIFLGFVILEIGTILWSLVARANIRTTPYLPWSFPLMTVVLVVFWKYLDGKWIPNSTQQTRQMWMRANSLKPSLKKWGWIAAILQGITIMCLIILGMRLSDVPSGQIMQLERIKEYPTLTILSLIVMTSLVAGIVEEVSFRGYMQKPMEVKYGPKIAIILVALFFTLLHLPNATITPHLIPIFFIGSIGWGILAYLTDSIIPGVVIHCIIDILSYLWIWRNLDYFKIISSNSAMNAGIDSSLIGLLLVTITFSFLLILSFRKLHATRKQQ